MQDASTAIQGDHDPAKANSTITATTLHHLADAPVLTPIVYADSDTVGTAAVSGLIV